MANPTDEHFRKVKKVLTYLRGTWDMGLMFQFQPPAAEQGVRTCRCSDFKELGLECKELLQLYSDAVRADECLINLPEGGTIHEGGALHDQGC